MLPEKDKKTHKNLNLVQERFCKLYATEREFFGNGVETYVEVYNIDKKKPNWYQVACQSASRLLSNAKIINRINDLLEETGFNDVAIDKQLSFLIHQHADFSSKLGAIKEYNKLKKRIEEKEAKFNQVIQTTNYERTSQDPAQLQPQGETVSGGIARIEQAVQDSSVQSSGGEEQDGVEPADQPADE